METYGQVLIMAIPVFLLLITLEFAWQWWRGDPLSPAMDTISSLSSGLTNSVKDVLGLSVSILSYDYMVNHFALYTIKTGWIVYVIAFLVLDFQGYWEHRLKHRVNILWNIHVIHHSSEEFNLSCALRQSISSFVQLFTFFLLPCALLGVETKVIAIVAPLQFFVQFWYHTRYIRTMGWLDYVIVTPSHHRVHHAINPVYVDKNYSQVFIFWDKLFGTFQAELDSEPPVYGVSRPVRTWNPIRINFQHLISLFRDAWTTRRLLDKITLWIRPTGWRPADAAARHPIPAVGVIQDYVRYAPPAPKPLIVWSWFQLGVLMVNTMYFFAHIGQIGSPLLFFYGIYVFLAVYAYTELMDRNRNALLWESFRVVYVVLIMWQTGSWFGLEKVISQGNLVAGVFSLLSWIGCLYFTLITPKDLHQESRKFSSLRLS